MNTYFHGEMTAEQWAAVLAADNEIRMKPQKYHKAFNHKADKNLKASLLAMCDDMKNERLAAAIRRLANRKGGYGGNSASWRIGLAPMKIEAWSNAISVGTSGISEYIPVSIQHMRNNPSHYFWMPTNADWSYEAIVCTYGSKMQCRLPAYIYDNLIYGNSQSTTQHARYCAPHEAQWLALITADWPKPKPNRKSKCAEEGPASLEYTFEFTPEFLP